MIWAGGARSPKSKVVHTPTCAVERGRQISRAATRLGPLYLADTRRLHTCRRQDCSSSVADAVSLTMGKRLPNDWIWAGSGRSIPPPPGGVRSGGTKFELPDGASMEAPRRPWGSTGRVPPLPGHSARAWVSLRTRHTWVGVTRRVGATGTGDHDRSHQARRQPLC